MSLATRCPACSTVFRVVQDQLKVSGGWVRCGHCHEVFNGLEALFELPPEPPAAPAAPPVQAPPAMAATTPMSGPTAAPAVPDRPSPGETSFELDLSEPELEPDEAAPDTPFPADAPSIVPKGQDDPPPAVSDAAPPAQLTHPPEPVAPTPFSTESAVPAPEPAAPSGLRAESQATAPAPEPEPEPAVPEDNQTGPDTATQVSATAFASWQAAEPSTVHQGDPNEDQASSDAADPAAPAGLADAWPARKSRRPRKRRTPKPSFVRQAEQAALWRRPAMRALLSLTALALGALLALQVVHQERDQIAARWPALQPGLQRWCELARCSLQPPRELASLTLDSSALARTPGPQVLRFEADLRNAAEHVVRAPALELSFTDNQGRPLARKVLLPEDLAAPADGIPADGVWHIDARLDTGDFRIASFSAEIFYP